MNTILEIYDKDNGGTLIFDLIDIIDLLSENIKNYRWIIWELEARAVANCSFNLLELEEKINNSKTGIEISWEELILLSKKTFQVINITVAAFEFNKSAPAFITENYLASNSEILIQAIDSTVWRISTKNPSIIKKLYNKFKNIKTVSSNYRII